MNTTGKKDNPHTRLILLESPYIFSTVLEYLPKDDYMAVARARQGLSDAVHTFLPNSPPIPRICSIVNRIEKVKWFLSRVVDKEQISDLAVAAAVYGTVPVLKYILVNTPFKYRIEYNTELVKCQDNIAIFRFLRERGLWDTASEKEMLYNAVRKNNIAVIKWLRFEVEAELWDKELCGMARTAGAYGHLELLKWLQTVMHPEDWDEVLPKIGTNASYGRYHKELKHIANWLQFGDWERKGRRGPSHRWTPSYVFDKSSRTYVVVDEVAPETHD